MSWDLRKDPLPAVEKVFVYGSYTGSTAPPGDYTARLTVGATQQEVAIQLLADPNIKASATAYAEQAALLNAIDSQIATLHNTVSDMRSIQEQLRFHIDLLASQSDYAALHKKGKDLLEKLSQWERTLIQPDQKTFQDVINFNNKLNAEWMHLKGYVDSPDPAVTQGAKDRFNDLQQEWKDAKKALQNLIDNEIATFNQAYKELNIPSLIVPTATHQ